MCFFRLESPEVLSQIQGAVLLDHVLYALSRMSAGLGVVSPLLLDPAWPEVGPPSSLQPVMAVRELLEKCAAKVDASSLPMVHFR